MDLERCRSPGVTGPTQSYSVQDDSVLASWPRSTIPCASTIVVLLLWPGATTEQVQYYIQGYRTLHPSIRILALPCSISSPNRLQQTLEFLAWPSSSSISTKSDVVLHLFGDYGASQGCQLLRAYKLHTNEKMPTKAIIMDAAPSLTLPSSWQGVSMSLSSSGEIFQTLLLLGCHKISSILGLQRERRSRTFEDLNDPSLTSNEARKCYVFDETSKMFFWSHPKKQGPSETYERSDYDVRRNTVGRMGRWSTDQERYWLGIENVMDGIL